MNQKTNTERNEVLSEKEYNLISVLRGLEAVDSNKVNWVLNFTKYCIQDKVEAAEKNEPIQLKANRQHTKIADRLRHRVICAVEDMVNVLDCIKLMRPLAKKDQVVKDFLKVIYGYVSGATIFLTVRDSKTVKRICNEIDSGVAFERFMKDECHLKLVPKDGQNKKPTK